MSLPSRSACSSRLTAWRSCSSHRSWGGSRIEAWTSVGALREQGGLDEPLDILARSARDPLEARAAWGRYWQHWWATREGTPPGDAPWRADADDRGWPRAPATLGAWERWNEPALADYNGMVWYRTQVMLSAEQAARGVTLELASDRLLTTGYALRDLVLQRTGVGK